MMKDQLKNDCVLLGGFAVKSVEAMTARDEKAIIRLFHWSWVVVLVFVGLTILSVYAHPMHTGMSAFEHYVRCYGAAFAGPFGEWWLPCCSHFRTLSFDCFLPLLFVIVTAAFYWKKRIRPLRIFFAIALCVWLFCGMSVLMIWK